MCVNDSLEIKCNYIQIKINSSCHKYFQAFFMLMWVWNRHKIMPIKMKEYMLGVSYSELNVGTPNHSKR